MRLLKYLIAALLVIASPAAAGWMPIADSIVTPVSNACSVASGTSITFTTQNIGVVNPNRISVVSINWDDSTNAGTASITAVTIGGLSMIKVVSALNGPQNSNSEIWYVSNPSGTTADIVITAATAINAVTIEVYSLIGFKTAPVASTFGTISVSQPYNNKQLALAAGSRQINVSTSLSNMANDFSSACGVNLWGVHASQRLSGNNQTLTSNINPTSNTPLIALAVWTPGSDPACSQSATFLARTSGLNATHTNAYSTLICGLVTDNIYSKLDVLHIYATQDSTTALLNLVSTSYTATLTGGASSFTADRGFTGVAAQPCNYLNTNFNPTTATTPKFVQNSAHISAWSVVDAGAINLALIGDIGGGSESEIYPKWTDNNAYFRVNSGGDSGVANATPTGYYLGNRSSSSATQGYKNSTNILTNNATTSAAPNNANFTVGASSACGASGNAQQVAQISIGSSLSSTDETNFYNRLRTYMTAVGVP